MPQLPSLLAGAERQAGLWALLSICGNPDVRPSPLTRSNLSLYSVWLGSDLSLLTSDSAEYVIFILNAGFHILF